jgi:hypothetical protein
MKTNWNTRNGFAALPLLVGVLVGCLFPSTGQNAMIAMSLEQLAGSADTIVVGTVLGQTSAWNEDRSAIHTDVVVSVDELVKGNAAGEVVVRVAGGYIESEDIGMGVSDTPKFRDGEQVVLFLNVGAEVATVTGQFQGKLTVTDGMVATASGEVVTVDEFIGAVLDAAN